MKGIVFDQILVHDSYVELFAQYQIRAYAKPTWKNQQSRALWDDECFMMYQVSTLPSAHRDLVHLVRMSSDQKSRDVKHPFCWRKVKIPVEMGCSYEELEGPHSKGDALPSVQVAPCRWVPNTTWAVRARTKLLDLVGDENDTVALCTLNIEKTWWSCLWWKPRFEPTSI